MTALSMISLQVVLCVAQHTIHIIQRQTKHNIRRQFTHSIPILNQTQVLLYNAIVSHAILYTSVHYIDYRYILLLYRIWTYLDSKQEAIVIYYNVLYYTVLQYIMLHYDVLSFFIVRYGISQHDCVYNTLDGIIVYRMLSYVNVCCIVTNQGAIYCGIIY